LLAGEEGGELAVGADVARAERVARGPGKGQRQVVEVIDAVRVAPDASEVDELVHHADDAADSLATLSARKWAVSTGPKQTRSTLGSSSTRYRPQPG
jgi:hypothetical protein